MCGDSVVVFVMCVVLVFVISGVVNFGQGLLSGLGANCCMG